MIISCVDKGLERKSLLNQGLHRAFCRGRLLRRRRPFHFAPHRTQKPGIFQDLTSSGNSSKLLLANKKRSTLLPSSPSPQCHELEICRFASAGRIRSCRTNALTIPPAASGGALHRTRGNPNSGRSHRGTAARKPDRTVWACIFGKNFFSAIGFGRAHGEFGSVRPDRCARFLRSLVRGVRGGFPAAVTLGAL